MQLHMHYQFTSLPHALYPFGIRTCREMYTTYSLQSHIVRALMALQVARLEIVAKCPPHLTHSSSASVSVKYCAEGDGGDGTMQQEQLPTTAPTVHLSMEKQYHQHNYTDREVDIMNNQVIHEYSTLTNTNDVFRKHT